MLHSVNRIILIIKERYIHVQRQSQYKLNNSPKQNQSCEHPKIPMLICGLGNPGEKYAHTRHNIGFAVIDVLADRHNVHYWKNEAGCQVSTINITNANGQLQEIILAKPWDFMNTSGGPLCKLARAHNITADQILVIHDEIDLEDGHIRFRTGGGLNAHNGLRSIADKFGTRDFMRLQCGISRPSGRMTVANYVLKELKGVSLTNFYIEAEAAADKVEELIHL